MWLVLCSAQDISALWAYDGLKRRGLHPIEVITDELLTYSLRFEHRIQAGTPITRITLADDRRIESVAIRGTLNRLHNIPTRHLQQAQASDRHYAEPELFALFLSWLYGLPGPLFNRPTPQGLSGAWRHLSEWIWLAGQAGLPVLPYRQSDTQSVPVSKPLPLLSATQLVLIVFNGKCFGTPVPPSVEHGCIQLAKLSQTALLGVEFQISANGTWLLINSTPMPDLRLGGQALLDELAIALQL
jgi:hypothetical protein